MLPPFSTFLERPLLAFLPAVMFGACYLLHRRPDARRHFRLILIAAGSWAAYAVYECGQHLWSNERGIPIRIDLFLIIPLLTTALIAGLLGCWRAGIPARHWIVPILGVYLLLMVFGDYSFERPRPPPRHQRRDARVARGRVCQCSDWTRADYWARRSAKAIFVGTVSSAVD